MSVKRVLICGVSGQLGSAVHALYSKDHSFEVFSLDKSEIKLENFFQGDITNKESLKLIFDEIKPEIVINTAALVHADLCETERELAKSINYTGNKNLLELSKEYDAQFVFMSSYYVFDGTKKDYDENSPTTPLNYYGETKVMSEEETLKYPKSIVIRASKIFSVGYDKRNFIARAHISLMNNQEVVAVDDQYNNPVHADFMADAIKTLVSMNKSGIYNVGGEDYVNNYEFAKRFSEYFGFDTSLVKAVKTDEATQAAKRPRDVNLNLEKLKSEGIKTHNLNEMFKLMEKYIKNE
ncbi:NAD(P)-dependent oxidoreductase [Candidatus Woesearchaeota archaeon]|nr:NAD(P)-dependent oxidoreductase [Candidatus Woesearchaeota archaeon]